MDMIRRNLYLEKIRPFIDADLIKILIGLRRSGKTILLGQIRELIREKGVPEENLIEINFESRKLRQLEDGDVFYQYVMERAEKIQGRVYLFLDEIQHVGDWQSVIPSFRVDLDCDIYVTGSNNKLLSGEAVTYLAGRYVAFHIYPFTLSEIRSFMKKMGWFIRKKSFFRIT